MRVLFVFVAVWVAIWPLAASAQTPSPVTQHYRAYNAAIERGDLAAAEQAAVAALAASEARNGDGGATVVLAANLAQVRLDLRRPAEALAPAQRALQLAEARPDAGVDPVYAGLLLGRAELAGSGVGQERRLVAAIEAAERAGGFEAERYDAGAALGQWAIEQRRFALGAQGYEVALRASAGEEEGQIIARARAHVGRGIALLMADRGRQFGTQRGASGQATRLLDRPSEEAPRAMAEAVRLIEPLARRAPQDATLMRAQSTFASATAWHYVVVSWFASMGWDLPTDTREVRGGLTFDLANDGRPACAFGVVARPEPDYPEEALMDFGVGAVVLRTVTNASGEVEDMRAIAGAGGQEFIDAVEAASGRWRVERVENSPPDCSPRTLSFIPFYFRIE